MRTFFLAAHLIFYYSTHCGPGPWTELHGPPLASVPLHCGVVCGSVPNDWHFSSLVTSVNTGQKNPELCAAFIAPRQHFNGINLDSLSPRDEGGEREWAWNYPAVARRRHTGLWLVILLLSRKLLLKHSLLELFWLWWVVRWYDPDKCILILSHFI